MRAQGRRRAPARFAVPTARGTARPRAGCSSHRRAGATFRRQLVRAHQSAPHGLVAGTPRGTEGRRSLQRPVPPTPLAGPRCLVRGEHGQVEVAAILRCAVQHARLAAHQQGGDVVCPERRKDSQDLGRDHSCPPRGGTTRPGAASLPTARAASGASTAPLPRRTVSRASVTRATVSSCLKSTTQRSCRTTARRVATVECAAGWWWSPWWPSRGPSLATMQALEVDPFRARSRRRRSPRRRCRAGTASSRWSPATDQRIPGHPRTSRARQREARRCAPAPRTVEHEPRIDEATHHGVAVVVQTCWRVDIRDEARVQAFR